jgi:hypothetical protein
MQKEADDGPRKYGRMADGSRTIRVVSRLARLSAGVAASFLAFLALRRLLDLLLRKVSRREAQSPPGHRWGGSSPRASGGVSACWAADSCAALYLPGSNEGLTSTT